MWLTSNIVYNVEVVCYQAMLFLLIVPQRVRWAMAVLLIRLITFSILLMNYWERMVSCGRFIINITPDVWEVSQSLSFLDISWTVAEHSCIIGYWTLLNRSLLSPVSAAKGFFSLWKNGKFLFCRKQVFDQSSGVVSTWALCSMRGCLLSCSILLHIWLQTGRSWV